jgi:hypothetical protein
MQERHFVMPLAFLSVNSTVAEFSEKLLSVNSRCSANSDDGERRWGDSTAPPSTLPCSFPQFY